MYDVGLVCLMNYSLGNNLVNYALYQCIIDRGYSVVLIGSTRDMRLHCKNRLSLWKKIPYDDKSIGSENLCEEELYNWNKTCRFFVTGSDQTLRYLHASGLQYMTYLPWVRDGKYKATFAASMVLDVFEGNNEIKEILTGYLNRFNRISIREKSGVKLLKEEFGVDSTCVLDPVFLCDKAHYEYMAQNGMCRIPSGKYVLGYFLDNSMEKETAVTQLANSFSNGINLLIQESLWCDADSYKGKLNALLFHKVEEWIAAIKESTFVVTDSFHCTVLCIIFRKQFVVIYDPDNVRGYARIRDILHEYGLEDRHLSSRDMFDSEYYVSHLIDYRKVYVKLDLKKKESKEYLDEMLREADCHDDSFCEADYIHKKKYDSIREEILIKKRIRRKRSDDWIKKNDSESDSYLGSGICPMCGDKISFKSRDFIGTQNGSCVNCGRVYAISLFAVFKEKMEEIIKNEWDNKKILLWGIGEEASKMIYNSNIIRGDNVFWGDRNIAKQHDMLGKKVIDPHTIMNDNQIDIVLIGTNAPVANNAIMKEIDEYSDNCKGYNLNEYLNFVAREHIANSL